MSDYDFFKFDYAKRVLLNCYNIETLKPFLQSLKTFLSHDINIMTILVNWQVCIIAPFSVTYFTFYFSLNNCTFVPLSFFHGRHQELLTVIWMTNISRRTNEYLQFCNERLDCTEILDYWSNFNPFFGGIKKIRKLWMGHIHQPWTIADEEISVALKNLCL